MRHTVNNFLKYHIISTTIVMVLEKTSSYLGVVAEIWDGCGRNIVVKSQKLSKMWKGPQERGGMILYRTDLI
jgi:hypothetical protein